MERVLGRFAPQIFAILRIIAGLMFMMHGTQKLFGWPAADMAPLIVLTSRSGIAGILEFTCGLLITIGLFAGTAAFIASGLMAAAYFIAHAKGGFFPILNRGELAVLYCFVWLYVSAHGSGAWSVEAMLKKTRPAFPPAAPRDEG